jgi:hypothetical protein
MVEQKPNKRTKQVIEVYCHGSKETILIVLKSPTFLPSLENQGIDSEAVKKALLSAFQRKEETLRLSR